MRYAARATAWQDLSEQHLRRRSVAPDRNKNKKQEALYARWWAVHFRGKRLNAVTASELEAAMYTLKEKGLSPQTVLHYMKFMRHVLNIAVRDDKIDKNPMSKLTLPKVTAGRVRFLGPQEEDAVYEAIGPTYAPWVRLAILTGMRQDEQFSLKWSDVDLEHGIITLSETKTGGVQYVRLSSDAKDILRAMTTWERSVWVFPSENPRTHMDARNFYGRHWMPAVREAGIEWATWHDLRHTYASRLAMSGQTEGTIASLLRHSTTALVKRYAHLSNSHLQAAVEELAGFGRDTAQTKSQATPAISIPTVTQTRYGSGNITFHDGGRWYDGERGTLPAR